jgi:hypothetical protein
VPGPVLSALMTVISFNSQRQELSPPFCRCGDRHKGVKWSKITEIVSNGVQIGPGLSDSKDFAFPTIPQ